MTSHATNWVLSQPIVIRSLLLICIIYVNLISGVCAAENAIDVAISLEELDRLNSSRLASELIREPDNISNTAPALFMSQGQTATIVVDDDGNGDFLTVAAAMISASPGDTVLITGGADGVHHEHDILITKDITIRGNGKNLTTIDGDHTGRVFEIRSGRSAHLSDMTIRNGYADFLSGGIHNNGFLTIENCVIKDNDSDGGGGISSFSGGDLVIKDSEILDNSCRDICLGGGVYISRGIVRIENSIISGNTSGAGGGLINFSNDTIITNTTIDRNFSRRLGGGILNIGSRANFILRNSTITNNQSDGAGGGLLNNGTFLVENSSISGNSTNSGGGAAYNINTSSVVDTLTFRNSTIIHNTAKGSLKGGGIHNQDVLHLENTIIANNTGGDCRYFGSDAVIATNTNNLIKNTGNDACDLVNGDGGSIIGQDPLLGILGDNGGSTFTQIPLSGSPAIDSGDDGVCLSTDQRGALRPADGNGNGNSNCDIGAVEVNANFPPKIISSSTISTAENSTQVHSISVSDPDTGDTLSFSLTGGFDVVEFAISPTGELSFLAAPDFDIPGDADSDNVYEVEVTVSDGNGGEDKQTILVIIINVNEAPVFTSPGTATIPENTTTVMTVTAEDPDGDSPIFSLTGGSDQALFMITSSGNLSFILPPDFENPGDADSDNTYEIEITVDDGLGNVVSTATQVIQITVVDVNESPVLTSPIDVSMQENTSTVQTVTATDQDGDALSYSISGGADAALFTIVNTGAIRFRRPPDYENPTDNNGDSIYEVEVTVSDGRNGFDRQTLKITVTNVNEPLVISGMPITNVKFNDPYYFIPDAVDPNGRAIVFSIKNKPSWADFDQATGSLSGTPKLSDAGLYENIVILASSGTDTVSLSPFRVVVAQINQPPWFKMSATNLVVCQNAGGQSISLIDEIFDGDFGTQQLHFIVQNDNPSLFGGLLGLGGQPTLSLPSGRLYFRGALHASGNANVSVRLSDDGGVSNGGQNVSQISIFAITIDPNCDDGAGEIFSPEQFDGSVTNSLIFSENFPFPSSNIPHGGELISSNGEGVRNSSEQLEPKLNSDSAGAGIVAQNHGGGSIGWLSLMVLLGLRRISKTP